jgi:cell fate (sporulation/competence/biofilm development) regulator YlbF (YheA/YmcA/DUF963 family)
MPSFNLQNAGDGDAGSGLDPATLQTMMEALPQIQQAQRRAQQLRAQQVAAQQMQDNPATQGNYQPTQMGGLYPTVATWHPDYQKYGQQIVGAMGNIAGNSQANSAEDTFNALRNKAILNGIQQVSGGAGSIGSGNGSIGSDGGSTFGGGNLWSM